MDHGGRPGSKRVFRGLILPRVVSQFSNDRDDERIERLASGAAVRKDGWKRTNEEMELLADDRREQGWDVVTAPAIHTDTVSPDVGDDPDRFGFVHVVADNHADEVRNALETASFSRYEAYRSTADGHAFLVVELLDEDRDTALLLASHYDRNEAKGMVTAARERDVLFTHLQTVDGTRLGSIRHEEVGPLLVDDA